MIHIPKVKNVIRNKRKKRLWLIYLLGFLLQNSQINTIYSLTRRFKKPNHLMHY